MKIIDPTRSLSPRWTRGQLLEQEILGSLEKLDPNYDSDKTGWVSSLSPEQKQKLLSVIEPSRNGYREIIDFIDLFRLLFPTESLVECRFIRSNFHTNPLHLHGDLAREEVREYIKDLPPHYIGDKKSWISWLSMEKMRKILALIESATPAPQDDYEDENEPSLRVFHPFTRLPLELRRQIWGEILIPYLKPRVHALKLNSRTNTSHSNQPLSPLLHTCSEARSYFLENTNTRFGFGTYVDFGIDTLYILETEDLKRDFSRLAKTKSIRRGQKWAISKELLVNARMYNFTSDREHLIASPGCLVHLFSCMPAIKDLAIVFDDKRGLGISWADNDVSLLTMSVNQKKRLPERSYMRHFVGVLEKELEYEDGDIPFLHQFSYLSKECLVHHIH